MLDASEYLHLAMHASQENDHHAALHYLNQALQNEPDNAAVRYFLAAEHAELGLFERACSGMREALELDPQMDIARFQLGLLYLQLKRTDEAKETFSVLHSMNTEASLRAFAGGYLKLIDEASAEAVELFEQGLSSCDNAALTADMTRVLASLKSASHTEDTDADNTASPPLFLGAYRDTLETP